jgi:hypothetical protein
VFANASGGEGLGTQNLKASATARFWAASGYYKVEGGFCRVTDPPAMVICEGGDLGVSWYGGGR